MNSIQQIDQSAIKPKKQHQQDKYQGQLNPLTKEKHGKGIYYYNNTFFKYQGEYKNNIKSGPGILKLANGTIIQANFVDGQIQGSATIKYGDGSTYKGALHAGEKHGYGEYISQFQSYKGNWKQNNKSGNGIWQTTQFTAHGMFQNNKLHGSATIKKWDGQFRGDFQNGKKKGHGSLIDHSLNLKYDGQYQNDLMNGQGRLEYLDSKYLYEGKFLNGTPVLLPNQYEIGVSFNKLEQSERKKSQIIITKSIDYELEADPFNIEIKCSYQGPQILDENQPGPEQIDKLQKAWIAENKKIKNPPPMPDFSAPKMKKPSLVLVKNESNRLIGIQLFQLNQGKQDKRMRIQWRQDISKKRLQNQNIKKELLKKAEEDDKKKGAKKENKKDQSELKVNIFKEDSLQKFKIIKAKTHQGIAQISNIEFPDDFPPGKYYLKIDTVSRHYLGLIPSIKIELNINPKGFSATKNAKKK